MDRAAYLAQLLPDYRIGSQSLDLNIVRPLLHGSLDEASQTLDEKLKRSDLHSLLIQPRHDINQALDTLRGVLALPRIGAQINITDINRYTPLDYAVDALPEAVELLLQAGACPNATRQPLLHKMWHGQWKAVSSLIRAGYPMNKRDTDFFGVLPLHAPPAYLHPSYRYALELVRHGGHHLDWNLPDDEGITPLFAAEYFANQEPNNEQLSLICKLYRTQSIPPHAQFISSFDGERLMTPEEIAMRPRISLIDTCLTGDIGSIGPLVAAGAMVNERDEEGRTLLHLIAMGKHIPNAYSVALELERHGGYGIDRHAMFAGKTAIDTAKATLQRGDLDEDIREDMEKFLAYLEDPRLPAGEQYVFPCMDPNFCNRCHSLRCTCIGYDVPNIPGTFRS